MAKADLMLAITGDSRKLRQALDSARKDVSGFKSKLGGIGSIAAGVFGGAAAMAGVNGLASAFGTMISEARESARVGRLTEAVIKSTGGAAGVTAAQVGTLAEAISNKTGIDDEAIQSAENLMLTFTGVRNEAGKNNKVFNQATQAAVDMAAGLKGAVPSAEDIRANVQRLGFALNDPIKGVGRLSKAGVTFTEQQKDQIKTLVKSGNTLEAQKMILAELGKEFGGAAAAAADPMQKLSTTVNNAAEKIGTSLLPVINKIATWLGDYLPKAIDKLSGWWNTLTSTFKSDGISGVFKKIGDNIAKAWPSIREKLGTIASGIWSWLKAQVPIIAAKLVEWGKQFVEWIYPQIPPMLKELGKLLGKIGDWALNTGLPLLIEKLKEWGLAFIKWAGPMIPPMLLELGKLLLSLGSWILTDALPMLIGKLAQWALAFIGWVLPMIPKLILKLGELELKLVNWIITTALPAIVSKVAEWGGAFLGWIADTVTKLPGKLWDLIVALGDWINNTAVPKAIEYGGKIAKGIGDALTSGIKAAMNLMISLVEDGINGAISVANFLIDGINVFSPKDIPHIPKVDLPELAEGGIVTRPTIALIGEAGPEAVVPLSRIGRPADIGTGGGIINVQVDVKVDVDPLTGRKIYRLVQQDQRTNGPWAIKISPSAA